MPARPVRGLRLAPLACVLAVALPGAAAAAGPIPTPIGVGPLYHPVAAAVPVAFLTAKDGGSHRAARGLAVDGRMWG